MDIKTFNLINRLPDYIPASLNANKGNSAVLSSLLETYTKNGTITFEESNILYTHFMSDDDSPTQTRTSPQPDPQPRPQPNPQPARPASTPQKNTAISPEFKKARTDYIVFLVITIIMLPVAVIAVCLGLSGNTSKETVFPAGNLANCIDTVSADEDYLITDAKIVEKYAEFFRAEGDGLLVDESSKTDIKDLYVAIITDKDGKEYFTSISVDRTSELGIKLENHDFMSSRYTLSGYFTAQPLTAHKAENKTAVDYFDEVIGIASLLDYTPLRWDFKYLFPSTADYAQEKAEAEGTNAEGIIMAVVFFIAAIVLLDMTYNRRKKYIKLKKEFNE